MASWKSTASAAVYACMLCAFLYLPWLIYCNYDGALPFGSSSATRRVLQVQTSPPQLPPSPSAASIPRSPPPAARGNSAITCRLVWSPAAPASPSASSSPPPPTSPPLVQQLGPWGPGGGAGGCGNSSDLAKDPGWNRVIDLVSGVRRYDLSLSCSCSGAVTQSEEGCYGLGGLLAYYWWTGPPWLPDEYSRREVRLSPDRCNATSCTASLGAQEPPYAQVVCFDVSDIEAGAATEGMTLRPPDADVGAVTCAVTSYQRYEEGSRVYGKGETAELVVQGPSSGLGPEGKPLPCAEAAELPQDRFHNWANTSVLTCICSNGAGGEDSDATDAGSCFRLARSVSFLFTGVPNTASYPVTPAGTVRSPLRLTPSPADCTSRLCVASTRLAFPSWPAEQPRSPFLFGVALCLGREAAEGYRAPQYPTTPAGAVQCSLTLRDGRAGVEGQSLAQTDPYPTFRPIPDTGVCWVRRDMAQFDQELRFMPYIHSVDTEQYGATLTLACECSGGSVLGNAANRNTSGCFSLARTVSLAAWDQPLWQRGGEEQLGPLIFSPSDCTAERCVRQISTEHAPYATALCTGAWPYEPQGDDLREPTTSFVSMPYCVLDLYQRYEHNASYYPPASGGVQPLYTPDVRFREREASQPPACWPAPQLIPNNPSPPPGTAAGAGRPPPPPPSYRRRLQQRAEGDGVHEDTRTESTGIGAGVRRLLQILVLPTPLPEILLNLTLAPSPPPPAPRGAAARLSPPPPARVPPRPAPPQPPPPRTSAPSPPPPRPAPPGPPPPALPSESPPLELTWPSAFEPFQPLPASPLPSLPVLPSPSPPPAAPSPHRGGWGAYARLSCACASSLGSCYPAARRVAWFYSLKREGELPRAGELTRRLSFQPWQCTGGSCVASIHVGPNGSTGASVAPGPPADPRVMFSAAICYRADAYAVPDVGQDRPTPSQSSSSPSPATSPRTPPAAASPPQPPPAPPAPPQPPQEGDDSAAAGARTVTGLVATSFLASVGLTAASSTLAAVAPLGSAAAGAGAGAGAGSAGSGAAGAASKITPLISMVQHMQFFALTGQAAAPLGEAYRQVAGLLGWTNFQYGVTGLQPRAVEAEGPERPEREPHPREPRDRRSLQQLQGPSDPAAAADAPPLAPAAPPRAAPFKPDLWEGVTEAEADSYNTLVCVCILFCAAMLLHWLLLRLWDWLPLLRPRPLPELLVFPSPELKLLSATLTSVAGAAGALVAVAADTHRGVATALAAVTCAYVAIVMVVLAAVVKALVRRLAWYGAWREQQRQRPGCLPLPRKACGASGVSGLQTVHSGGTESDAGSGPSSAPPRSGSSELCSGRAASGTSSGRPSHRAPHLPLTYRRAATTGLGPGLLHPSGSPASGGLPSPSRSSGGGSGGGRWLLAGLSARSLGAWRELRSGPSQGKQQQPQQQQQSGKEPQQGKQQPSEKEQEGKEEDGQEQQQKGKDAYDECRAGSDHSKKQVQVGQDGQQQGAKGEGKVDVGSEGRSSDSGTGGGHARSSSWLDRLERALRSLEAGEWLSVYDLGWRAGPLEPHRTRTYVAQGMSWKSLTGPFYVGTLPAGTLPAKAATVNTLSPAPAAASPAGPAKAADPLAGGGGICSIAGETASSEVDPEREDVVATFMRVQKVPHAGGGAGPLAHAAQQAECGGGGAVPWHQEGGQEASHHAQEAGAGSDGCAAAMPEVDVGGVALLMAADQSARHNNSSSGLHVGAAEPPLRACASAPVPAAGAASDAAPLPSPWEKASSARLAGGHTVSQHDALQRPQKLGPKAGSEAAGDLKSIPSIPENSYEQGDLGRALTTIQLYERYGELLTPYDGDRWVSATFAVPSAAATALAAFLLGLQAGEGVAPGGWAALAATAALLAVKAVFTLYLLAVRPHTNLLEGLVEGCCGALETGVVACLLALQFVEAARAQRGMLAMEMVVLVLQVLAVFVLSVLPGAIELSRFCGELFRRSSPEQRRSGGEGEKADGEQPPQPPQQEPGELVTA